MDWRDASKQTSAKKNKWLKITAIVVAIIIFFTLGLHTKIRDWWVAPFTPSTRPVGSITPLPILFGGSGVPDAQTVTAPANRLWVRMG
jgi:hypothetical protein